MASDGQGIYLGNDSAVDNSERIFITATGVVSGGTNAIVLSAYQSELTNYGLIDGNYAVRLFGTGVGMSHVINGGTINGTAAGVRSDGHEAFTLLNTGTITSAGYAVYGSDFSDSIRNIGHLFGVVSLGTGDDVYDGRGGFVEGTIFGGGGDDTFRVGSGIETIDGGAGINTLDFRQCGAIHVALDGSFANTGTATDDTYIGIENILGSRFGADMLTGDAEANTLTGFGGKDLLSGGAGNDSLAGGNGFDALFGGAGNDRFVFNAPTEGRDLIGDFHNSGGDDDAILISAAGFGAGLVAGVLPDLHFQVRADNLAQYADDRFIYNTATHAVWFDANGSAMGGLTLIAVVQAGATLSAADILIF